MGWISAKLEDQGRAEAMEKGGEPQVVEREGSKRWRQIRSIYVYPKVIISLLAVFFLLWQYESFSLVARASYGRQLSGVPQYVLDYAPLVWLDTAEAYFPSDMHDHLANTSPNINYTTITHVPSPLTLHNLNALNSYGDHGINVFLTSNVDVTTAPQWLDGVVPDSHRKTNNAVSCAVIMNDHGSGAVDVFYMYFYAYNLGNTVFFRELGDHIGDWEHNMIRFQDGEPQAVWFSQHDNGQAFTYNSVEKEGLRPIVYSARGSHANYAIAGPHDHLIPDLNLPAGLLLDHTSQGILWDPTLNAYFYNYNGERSSFESINGSPIGAMTYRGRWGDEQYPNDDPRQPAPFFGFSKFVGGPSGPWDKGLNRTHVCPDNGIPCFVRSILSP